MPQRRRDALRDRRIAIWQFIHERREAVQGNHLATGLPREVLATLERRVGLLDGVAQ